MSTAYQMTHYYEILLSGLNLPPLSYHSSSDLSPYTQVLVSLKSKKILGYILRKCDKPNFKTAEILEIYPAKLTKIQIELLNFISYYYTTPKSLSVGLFTAFSPCDEPNLSQTQSFLKEPNLNEKQKKALKFAKEHKTSLLFGDTGSGKSEIYISLIKEHLNNQNEVLLLMPEISLTPQMQNRLKEYFGDKFGIWHSKLTPKKRKQTLQKFLKGEIKMIAGARSSLFLPFQNLSLIIVDEEHDDSYKSAQNPHYNARDLALFLASKFDIKVLLGSATPSLNTFSKQPNFRLKGTFYESSKSIIYDQSETKLSDKILNELKFSLANGKQAVVFLPTRANFRYLICKECSHTIKCPFCSVGMSLYKRQNLLKCQYCGFKIEVPQSCESCGSDMIEARKLGTDELLEALKTALPTAKTSKFDRDEITTQSKLEKTLKAFNAKEIDILVGTQMLSKGHDYHNVDLAVVMGVDELLNFPDFRARERVLSLVMQVAGRAGRSGSGRVVIQSLQTSFFEKFTQDYDLFLQEEMVARNPLYPPFTRLLRIVISHNVDSFANELTLNLTSKIQTLLKQSDKCEIIGFGKCAIERMGNKFRYEILLRSSSHKELLAVANKCKGQFIDIDIDPINFS